MVFRPKVEGRARSIIERFDAVGIDLLSMSGHHASGFSGGADGAARFDTERLGRDLEDAVGVEPFFTHPAMVMLQGCRTDVESVVHRRPARVHPSRDRRDRRPSQRVRSAAGGGATDRRRAAGVPRSLSQRLHPRLLGDAGARRPLRDLLPGDGLAARSGGDAGGRRRSRHAASMRPKRVAPRRRSRRSTAKSKPSARAVGPATCARGTPPTGRSLTRWPSSCGSRSSSWPKLGAVRPAPSASRPRSSRGPSTRTPPGRAPRVRPAERRSIRIRSTSRPSRGRSPSCSCSRSAT